MEVAFVCFSLAGLGLAVTMAKRDERRRDAILVDVLAEMKKNDRLHKKKA